MITVFYDGKCGLCTKEIRHYQKIAPEGVFDWCDITRTPDPLHKLGISTAEGLKILHVSDDFEKIHKGVKANILIWKHLKYWKILAYIVQFPPIYIMVHMAYNIFAKWRFKKYPHCQL